MSRVDVKHGLEDVLKSKDKVFVLFYASWCPFSMAFLPIYERHADGREKEFVRVVLDGNEALFEEQAITVYPTVLFFRNGEVSRRLDGKHLVGLKEKQLADLITSCEKGRA